MRIYSCLDRKMGEYGQLALATNDETVRRALVDGISGSGAVMEKHPEDFDLMFLGVFDEQSGELTAQLPRLVANVGELIAASRPKVVRDA